MQKDLLQGVDRRVPEAGGGDQGQSGRKGGIRKETGEFGGNINQHVLTRVFDALGVSNTIKVRPNQDDLGILMSRYQLQPIAQISLRIKGSCLHLVDQREYDEKDGTSGDWGAKGLMEKAGFSQVSGIFCDKMKELVLIRGSKFR